VGTAGRAFFSGRATARANSVWREKCAVFHASTMRVKDAKKAAKLQGAKLQGAIAQTRRRALPQAAEDATFRQGGVDVVSSFGGTGPEGGHGTGRRTSTRHRKSDLQRSSRLPLR
jgi:hypothetical protein